MLIRLFKMFILVVFGLVLLGIALAVWMTTTTAGNRELSTLISLIEPRIKMDIRGGNLLNGVEAHNISWTDDFISVSANGIKSDWKPSCFIARTLCAKTIHLDSLTIKTRSKRASDRRSSVKIPNLKIPVNLTLSDLQVGLLSIDYNDNSKPVEIENIRVSASSRGKFVDVKRLSARFKNIIATSNGSVDLHDNISVSLFTTAIIEGVFEEHDLVLDGGVNGSLDKLVVAGTTAGAVESTFLLNLNALAPDVPSKARINWNQAGWPFSDHKVVKSTNGQLVLDGNIKQYKLSLTSDIKGKDIPESVVELRGEITPDKLISDNIIINTLNGKIEGTGLVDWTNRKTRVVWASQISFQDIDPAVYNPDFPGRLAGTVFASGSVYRDKTWTLDLKPAVVQGILNDHPMHAHAILVRSGKAKWDIESLRLISKDNQFSVSGSVDDNWAMAGELQLTKLQQLLPDASGSITGAITVSGPTKQPITAFDIKSKQLLWKQDSAEDLALAGRVDNFFNKRSIVKLDAKKLTVDGRMIGALDMEFTGRKQLHNIKLNAQSINNTKASVTLDGELLENRDWKGTLFGSTLELPGHNLTLASATKLHFDSSANALIVAPHCWGNRDTKVCLKNTLNASKNGHAEIAISPYSISQLNTFLPPKLKLAGRAEADIELDWGETTATGFRAVVNAKLSDGKMLLKSPDEGGDLQLDYKSISIDSFMDRGDIRSNIVVNSSNLGTADISFSIKPDIKPLSFTRGTLSLSDLDIRFLQPFLPDFQTINGTISANGKITGAVVDPAFIGDIVLTQPILKSEKLPLQINGGKITAAIAGRTANIYGTVNSGEGHIKLFGEADWEDLDAWSLIVNAQGDKLVISQKPLLESEISPNIVVSFKPNKINVGGNITIVSAAINIKEIPEGATNLSPDIVLAQSTTDEVLNEPKWALASDITIILGDAVKLSGYGMRAQLEGDFRVVKTDNKPLLLFGEIEIPKGIYKSYGQDLKVVDGQVIFVGPINQTTLNIDAYRTVDDVTAGLHLSGTIDKPEVTLYSDPFLEQERILAYIVLGRDIAAGDNNDSNILATAALSMGISNGRGLATDIAEAFGIREFNIEASGRGEDTQVLLSGRLSEKLLVRYGVGVFTTVNTLYLRYDLSKKLYLETAQGLESAADLIYSFEF